MLVVLVQSHPTNKSEGNGVVGRDTLEDSVPVIDKGMSEGVEKSG